MSVASPTLNDGLRAIQTKISDIVQDIAQTQQQMDTLVRKSVALGGTHSGRISALERELENLKNENERLRHERSVPDAEELANAIASRDDARAHLRDSYQVQVDVLKAHVKLLESVINKLPSRELNMTPMQEQKTRRNHLTDAQVLLSSSSSSASTTPNQTQQITPWIGKSSPLRPTHSEPGPSRPLQSSPLVRSSTEITSPPRISINDDSDVIRDAWCIHYGLPATSEIFVGPITRKKLESIVHDPIKLEHLNQLETTKSYPPMRIEIPNKKTGFVLDPILAEAPSGQSYILDWADRNTTKMMPTEPQVLHTFFYPLDEGAWFYIGKLTWELVNRDSIWSSLNQADRRQLRQKLWKRQEHYTEKQIGEQLHQGQLQQLVMQISGEGHALDSMALAQRMGYQIKQINERGMFE